MLNHIVIMGRLTRDPELRYTQSNTPVASMTLAVDRDYTPQGGDRETDFIDCVAWRGTAEFASKYFFKGQMAVVEGRLQSRKWQDRDGNNRTSWEIVVSNLYFGEKKDSNRGSYSNGSYQAPPPAAAAPQQYSRGPGNYGNPNVEPPQNEYGFAPQQQTFRDLDDYDGELPF